MKPKKTISKTNKTLPQLSQTQKDTLKFLKELTGSGAGVWNEDAQAYVNRLRDHDRF